MSKRKETIQKIASLVKKEKQKYFIYPFHFNGRPFKWLITLTIYHIVSVRDFMPGECLLLLLLFCFWLYRPANNEKYIYTAISNGKL